MEQLVSTTRRNKLKKLTFFVGLALPFVAQAQSTDSNNTAAGTTAMPQVQVQAQKLTDNIGSYTIGRTRTATPLDLSQRDTPQSVSVITQQRIEDQGLLSITDVANNVTGISVNQYESHRGALTARGFEVTNLQIDNIPTTWEAQWSSGEVLSSLIAYDRVEVVRGATGLMTGAGTPSAAINLVRKRAFSKKLHGTVDATVGRWDQHRVSADVSTPLNESGSIRGRVAGEYAESESWLQYREDKDRTLYATVEADIGRDGTLSAGFSRQKMSPRGSTWGGLPYRYTDGSIIQMDRSKSTGTPWTGYENQYDSFFTDYQHQFANGWNLRLSYTDGDREGFSKLLYLSGVPDRVSGIGIGAFAGSYLQEKRQKDFGIQVNGPFSAFGRQHEAAIGYQHSKTDFSARNRQADFGLGPFVAPPVGDFNNWNLAAYPEPVWGPLALSEGHEVTQQALYGMARFSLTDNLKAIVGARVTKYEKNGFDVTGPTYSLNYDNEVVPYAGLVFDLNETYSVYASHTSIFEPQNKRDRPGNYLDPIEGKASEVGIKGEFFDRRVNASLAIFHLKQDKLGVDDGTVDRDGDGPRLPETAFREADGATSKGIEADVSGEIVPGLNASIGYSIFRAKEASGIDFNTIFPRKTLRSFASYRLPGDLRNLTIGGGVNWQSRTYTVDAAGPIQQSSYALVNLMARYEFSKQLSAQLNVSNATDRKIFAMFEAFNQITYGAPRSTSVTLRYRF